MTAFNVLTSPWITLDDRPGEPASYVELMCGARDGADVVHPRDDVRFFTRMLLSALTQALFGDMAGNATALRGRVDEPLPRDEVEARVARGVGFELVNDADFGSAFLQGPQRPSKSKASSSEPPREEDDDETGVDSLLYDLAKHRLTRSPVDSAIVSAESAVPLLYASQAFARKGGRGYFTGIRGAPPVTTLIELGSVRASAWANVLHGERRQGFGDECEDPWRQDASDAAGAIGLIEGLFWQPLAVRLSWSSTTATCAASGRALDAGEGIRVERLGGRMKAAGVPSPHPYSPWREDGRKRKYHHLASGRPVWTGLSDVLPGVHEDGTRRATVPAPVVEQWAELDRGDAKLIVLEYVAPDANVLARFVDLFPLSAAIHDPKLADFAEMRVKEAVDALAALRTRLFPPKKRAEGSLGALRGRTGGRRARSDVTERFWQRTEPLFWRAFDARVDKKDERDQFRKGVRDATLELFDDATSVLDGDPAGLARTVQARTQLRRDLKKVLRLDAEPHGARP